MFSFSKEILVESFNYYLENERYVLIKLLFIGEVSCFCTVRKLRLLFYIIFFLIQVHCIIQVTYLYCSKSIARLLFVFVFLWFCFRIQIVQRSLKKKLMEMSRSLHSHDPSLIWQFNPVNLWTFFKEQFNKIVTVLGIKKCLYFSQVFFDTFKVVCRLCCIYFLLIWLFERDIKA